MFSNVKNSINIKNIEKNINKLENKKIIDDFCKIVFNEHKIKINQNQKIAAIAMAFDNKIIEMGTGEGKTLAILMSAYFRYVLNKEQTYIITANEYLSERDYVSAKKMLSNYGIKIGLIKHKMYDQEKKENYKADIIFTTINALIFDYLHDNISIKKDDLFIVKKFENIIIDEADMTLIDYSTYPYVINGKNLYDEADYYVSNAISLRLKETKDYTINSGNKIELTDDGYDTVFSILVERKIIENDDQHSHKFVKYVSMIINALKANNFYNINDNYIVDKNKIMYIDKETGRITDLSLSNGLHQAIEAKEKLPINLEKTVLSYITIPYFLKNFKSLSGLTGTVAHEKEELCTVYNLKYLKIKNTHIKNIKENKTVYFHEKDEKFKYLLQLLNENKERPVLIGSVKIQTSEEISNFLTKNNIEHVLLNAKNNAEESDLIAKAGNAGQVTISTNISGRGVDIILGKNKFNNDFSDSVWKLEHDRISNMGGLLVINFEINEIERFDKQLYGRCARQKDAGGIYSLVCLDDILEMNVNWFFKLHKNQKHFENKKLDNAVKTNQKINSSKKYNKRLNLYQYDNINNKQREIYYEFRNNLFNSSINEILIFLENTIFDIFINKLNAECNYNSGLNVGQCLKKMVNKNYLSNNFNFDKYNVINDIDNIKEGELYNDYLFYIFDNVEKAISKNDKNLMLIRKNIIEFLDQEWSNHLTNIDKIKNVSFYKGMYSNKVFEEYNSEIFNSFQSVFNRFHETLYSYIIDFEKNKFVNFCEMDEKQFNYHYKYVDKDFSKNLFKIGV